MTLSRIGKESIYAWTQYDYILLTLVILTIITGIIYCCLSDRKRKIQWIFLFLFILCAALILGVIVFENEGLLNL